MSLLRQLLFLLVLAGVGYGGFIGYQKWQQTRQQSATANGAPQAPQRPATRATDVKTVRAGERTLLRIVEAVGSTRAAQTVDIKPQADGTITEIAYQPGQRVEKGTVLFRLDDDIQRADLAQARAELVKAQQALERGQSLRQSRVMAAASLEELEAARASAQAQVERAERRLADRTIRAPFDGTPGFSAVDMGAQVENSTELTGFNDLSSVIVEFAVPEEYFAIARTGLVAKASTAAWPGRTFQAPISAIAPAIDPVSRSFVARARIANDDGALASGMFMRLKLELASTAAVMVPEEAVTVEGSTAFVFVVNDDKAERRAVKTGGREPGWVQILDGVTAGEEVVFSGTSKVRPGGAVKVVNAQADATGATATQGGATQ
jgi:membrane fusion protein (multidrug efflux system)